MDEQLKTEHCKERSTVPEVLHPKALSCYVGLPAELLLPTNASAYVEDEKEQSWSSRVW